MKNKVRKKLIDSRISLQLTQKEIAKKVGITTSYYGMIEQGTRNPKLSLAKKIADVFNEKIDDIFF